MRDWVWSKPRTSSARQSWTFRRLKNHTGSSHLPAKPHPSGYLAKTSACDSRNILSKWRMRVGYARLAVTDSDPSRQLEALREVGCERVFTDEGVNAGALKRPALDRMLRTLRRGDVLVVWKLDRLGRSLSHLIQLARQLGDKGIGLRSLTEGIDTTSSAQGSFFDFVEALAEFERGLITERTRAGSAAARLRGVKAGRKPKLTPEKVAHAQRLIDQGESPGEVAKSFDVSVATLYRHLPAAASNRTTFDLFTRNHENLRS